MQYSGSGRHTWRSSARDSISSCIVEYIYSDQLLYPQYATGSTIQNEDVFSDVLGDNEPYQRQLSRQSNVKDTFALWLITCRVDLR